MEHYKSWSNLNKMLNQRLCDTLKGQIQYFLTRYHQVHNSYGRASILLNGKELVCFSWVEMYRQECPASALYEENPHLSWDGIEAIMKPKWDEECTYCEMDFLSAALQFLDLPIQKALQSDNFIIKILAILDRRVGKRTLRQIAGGGAYAEYPLWVRQFYDLRLSALQSDSRDPIVVRRRS